MYIFVENFSVNIKNKKEGLWDKLNSAGFKNARFFFKFVSVVYVLKTMYFKKFKFFYMPLKVNL